MNASKFALFERFFIIFVKISPCFVNFFDKNNLFWLEKRKKCKKNLQERKNGNTFAVSYNNSTLTKNITIMEIRLENINFRYRGSKTEVLSHLSLNLTKNKIYGLLGKNGVGKSTLLNIISGLLKPDRGQALINGTPCDKGDPELLEDIFFVTEEFSLPNVTLSSYVKMNAPFYPNFSQELLNDCLREFELPQDVKLGELSMGQKKKVFMSFALATQTKVLLMDEPTNGLDIPSKSQFRRTVSRCMNEERTIVISTHQVHDIEQMLDHIVILSSNGVLLDKSTEEISRLYVFEQRSPNDMADVIYAEPSLQGNSVMAPRGTKPETQINLELLFNSVTSIRE